jgi:hypothetical protein
MDLKEKSLSVVESEVDKVQITKIKFYMSQKYSFSCFFNIWWIFEITTVFVSSNNQIQFKSKKLLQSN